MGVDLEVVSSQVDAWLPVQGRQLRKAPLQAGWYLTT